VHGKLTTIGSIGLKRGKRSKEGERERSAVEF
jgi:hypothetical protein